MLSSTLPLPRNIQEWCRLPSIKEKLVPQGCAEDATARNANLHPFDVAGVTAVLIVHTNAVELDDYKIDCDNGSIAVGDIPQQPPHVRLVVNNTDDNDAAGSHDDDDDDDTESSDDNKGDDDKDNENLSDEENNESGSDQGVQRLRCRGKCVTQKYADYSLWPGKKGQEREARRALICNRCVFFSTDDLSDAKPIPGEDREEYALGVALVHYSMNSGIKKFKAKGKAGVTKELTQMHGMREFLPIEMESLTYDKKKKDHSLLMFLK